LFFEIIKKGQPTGLPFFNSIHSNKVLPAKPYPLFWGYFLPGIPKKGEKVILKIPKKGDCTFKITSITLQ